MMRTLLLWVLGAFLLAGCCSNPVCDCRDGQEDNLYFRFDTTDTVSVGRKGYKVDELDSIMVRRYLDPLPVVVGAGRPAYDSLLLVRRGRLALRPVVIGNATPFVSNGRKPSSYTYRLVLRSRQSAKVFKVDSIRLKGSFEGDGCCTCYRNKGKTARVNGQDYDPSETSPQVLRRP